MTDLSKVPIYNRKPTQPKHDLALIIDKVKQLKELTATTGFITSRSIGLLLKDLDAEELVLVNRAINPKL